MEGLVLGHLAMKYVTDQDGQPIIDANGNYVVINVPDDPTLSSREISLGSYRSRYTITLHQPDGSLVADISGLCLRRQFSLRRNRAEQVSLTLHLAAAQDLARRLGTTFDQLFAPGVTELRISRGNRTLLGTQVQYIDPRVDTNSGTLDLRATGFLDILQDRLIQAAFLGVNSRGETVYANTDIGAVAWSLISKTQEMVSGELGITQGVIQTSRPISETYQPYGSSIKEALIGLTERINSVDIEFTYDKKFNVYYPGIGTQKTELLFTYPGNIVSLGLPRDATTLVNVSFNRGSGNGGAQPIETATDAASANTYTRRERIDDYPSISVPATLSEKGQETIRLYARPVAIPGVTLDGTKEPFLGSYWLGDRVRFSVPGQPAFIPLNEQTWRINEIAVAIDDLDHEDITLKVGYA